jgi:GT2 family glycosyltransferase
MDWDAGDTKTAGGDPGMVAMKASQLLDISSADAYLFWDRSLGKPDEAVVARAIEYPGDVWHAGLRLGAGGLPRLLDTVAPTWMLNCDPDPEIEASSWRVSLRACLVRTDALRQVGFIRSGFQTLDGAALEWGHRCAMNGVITRHIPWLLPENSSRHEVALPVEDELRFVAYRYKPVWTYWAAGRAVLRRPWRASRIARTWRELRQHDGPGGSALYSRPKTHDPTSALAHSISVILPTRGRYDYLDKCLETLRAQTLRPAQIVCIDQNEASDRRPELYARFDELPLHVIWQDGRGQSLARNAALEVANNEWLFFADDDSEYPPDTLEQHLRLCLQTGADGSTGLSLPPFEYNIPVEYRHPRLAYNLDTGNALIRRQAVLRAGGFDRNYDFGKGADTDLGMRLYLQGALLMHNPQARRLHYKAESGGLREYGAWWETRRIQLTQPRPAVTHSYWIMRYFERRAWREALMHNILFGNIPRHATRRASFWQILLHYLLEFLRLPLTYYQSRKSVLGAQAMLRNSPRLLGDPPE